MSLQKILHTAGFQELSKLITNIGENVGGKRKVVHCWQCYKLVSSLWRTVWRFLKNVKYGTLLTQAIKYLTGLFLSLRSLLLIVIFPFNQTIYFTQI